MPEKQTRFIEECSGILLAEKIQPEQRVFVDYFQCSTRGRNFKGQGIQNKQKNAKVSNPSKPSKGGCIFVDAAMVISIYNFRAYS